MRLFDLHCDTVTACYEQKCSIRNNSSLHISLERGKRFFSLGAMLCHLDSGHHARTESCGLF